MRACVRERERVSVCVCAYEALSCKMSIGGGGWGESVKFAHRPNCIARAQSETDRDTRTE